MQVIKVSQNLIYKSMKGGERVYTKEIGCNSTQEKTITHFFKGGKWGCYVKKKNMLWMVRRFNTESGHF